jgi:hypothetical protein
VKDLENAFSEIFNHWMGYIWLILLAIWGGTASYISRIKQGKIKAFSFVEMVGEWSISGFAGLLTAFICSEMKMSWEMTAFFTGVSGHLGGRALFMFETFVQKNILKMDFVTLSSTKKSEETNNGQIKDSETKNHNSN